MGLSAKPSVSPAISGRGARSRFGLDASSVPAAARAAVVVDGEVSSEASGLVVGAAHERSFLDDGRSDAGADGHQHHIVATAAFAVLPLCNGRHPGVVVHEAVTVPGVGGPGREVDVRSVVVFAVGGYDSPAVDIDDAGKGDAHACQSVLDRSAAVEQPFGFLSDEGEVALQPALRVRGEGVVCQKFAVPDHPDFYKGAAQVYAQYVFHCYSVLRMRGVPFTFFIRAGKPSRAMVS